MEIQDAHYYSSIVRAKSEIEKCSDLNSIDSALRKSLLNGEDGGLEWTPRLLLEETQTKAEEVSYESVEKETNYEVNEG